MGVQHDSKGVAENILFFFHNHHLKMSVLFTFFIYIKARFKFHS